MRGFAPTRFFSPEEARMDTGTHRRRVKDVCTIVAMSLVAGFFAMPAAAQQEASIIGVVTDPGGAVLPGVSISLGALPCRCRRSRP